MIDADLSVGGRASYRILHRNKQTLGTPSLSPEHYRRRAYWQLNANQLSSGNDAKSWTAERDEELERYEAAVQYIVARAGQHGWSMLPCERGMG